MPGPPPKLIADEVVEAVVAMATANPWCGYKRTAVMCWRAGQAMKDRVSGDEGSWPPAEAQDTAGRDLSGGQVVRTVAARVERSVADGRDVHPHSWTRLVVRGVGDRLLLAIVARVPFDAQLRRGRVALRLAAGVGVSGTSLRPAGEAPFLVTDNGPSLIARRFTSFVQDQFCHVRIQYRTPQQLGLLERFHATLKNEEVYWRLYDHPQHARKCLAEFRVRYNERRPHWALLPKEGGDVLVPNEVYRDGRKIQIPRWQSWAGAAQAKLKKMMEDAA